MHEGITERNYAADRHLEITRFHIPRPIKLGLLLAAIYSTMREREDIVVRICREQRCKSVCIIAVAIVVLLSD